MQPKPGDRVKVVTKDETVEGVLIPNEETDSIVVKLSSGYNVGIDRKKVKSMAVLESPKAKEAKEEKPSQAKKRPADHRHPAHRRHYRVQGGLPHRRRRRPFFSRGDSRHVP